ncbi:polysaccharide pyruvyl transferase family protein [Hydrocarboniphaga sp.]|uniref:polysaccharide pyruvyl transferase family protein n=1 Tax=Hydrocarboniphaga sp. TaxID=2033016 RepID=UPI003D14E6E1
MSNGPSIDSPAYGVLVHRPKRNAINIGDYVQAIAVRQALGIKGDSFLLEREELATYDGPPLRIVGQGWYCHTDGAWPPSSKIDYLPLGIHINPRSYELFLRPNSRAALDRIAPIGCRDQITKDFLDKHGVGAYFSACMTLTIQPSSEILRKPKAIYLIDASSEAIKLLPTEFKGLPVVQLSHLIPQDPANPPSHEELLKLAQARLDEYYRDAAIVVTSRLHALLPSMAMGIPCLWVERRVFDRRLDLARRYARRSVFPQPDRTGKAVADLLEKFVHPFFAILGSRGQQAAKLRITPKMDMKAERARILGLLATAMKKHGWPTAS